MDAKTEHENFRPNSRRVVELNGPLTNDVAESMIEKIKRLHLHSRHPITIIISSRGGHVSAFHELNRIIRLGDSTKPHCRYITMARTASSAAAYLLVSGHVSYALKNSCLGFHGVDIPGRSGRIKLEKKSILGTTMMMERENRKIAYLLSSRAAYRLAARFLLISHSRSYKIDSAKPWIFFQRLVSHLRQELADRLARRLLDEAFNRYKLAIMLANDFPKSQAQLRRRGPAPFESHIFKAAIDVEVDAHSSPKWTIDPMVAAEVMMNYILAREFARRRSRGHIHNLTRTFGREFLSRGEACVYLKLRASSPVKAKVYLYKTAAPYAQGLWYFTFAFCHRLLSGENLLSAGDAYWLGLIDGVFDENFIPGESVKNAAGKLAGSA